MTEGRFSEDAWAPPELAAELVAKLATGAYDSLAGRFLHSVNDDVDSLRARLEREPDEDLRMIRLQGD